MACYTTKDQQPLKNWVQGGGDLLSSPSYQRAVLFEHSRVGRQEGEGGLGQLMAGTADADLASWFQAVSWEGRGCCWDPACPRPLNLLLSPASISPSRGGRTAGAGVCLHVLLLVGVLIGSSWGAAPPPASALTPPTARDGQGRALSPVGLSNGRRNPHSEQRQGPATSLVSTLQPLWPEQEQGTGCNHSPLLYLHPL